MSMLNGIRQLFGIKPVYVLTRVPESERLPADYNLDFEGIDEEDDEDDDNLFNDDLLDYEDEFDDDDDDDYEDEDDEDDEKTIYLITE